MLRRLRIACCLCLCAPLLSAGCLSRLPDNRDTLALELLLGAFLADSPEFSAARVSRSKPQSIASGVGTALAFDRLDFATGSFAIAPATENLFVRTEDLYLLNGGVDFQTGGSGSRAVQFLDPAAVVGTQSTRSLTSSPTAHSIGLLRQLSAGATVALRTSQDSGSVLSTSTDATTQLSLTRLNRAVASAAFVRKTSVQAVSADVLTPIQFQIAEYDTGSYHSAAQQDRLLIQETGVYLIVGNGRLDSTGIAGPRGIELFVNSSTGSSFAIARDLRAVAAGGEGTMDVSAVYSLNAGDSVSLRYFHRAPGSHNLISSLTSMGIARLDSNPASSRKVLRRGAPAATQSIPTSTATAVVLSEISRADTAFSATDTSGTTIAEDGFYLFVANAEFVNQNFGRRDLIININGAPVARESRTSSTTGSGTLNLVYMQALKAGDTVQLFVQHNTGGNLALVPTGCFLQMVRLD